MIEVARQKFSLQYIGRVWWWKPNMKTRSMQKKAAEPTKKAEPEAEPKPEPQPKPKRKYAPGEIKPWVRPALADSSEDEGNALDEWQDRRFLELCLCGPGTDEATCTCGCMVDYTRSEWRKHKAKHGLTPPGDWAAWE